MILCKQDERDVDLGAYCKKPCQQTQRSEKIFQTDGCLKQTENMKMIQKAPVGALCIIVDLL